MTKQTNKQINKQNTTTAHLTVLLSERTIVTNTAKIQERRGAAQIGFPERWNSILDWTELNSSKICRERCFAAKGQFFSTVFSSWIKQNYSFLVPAGSPSRSGDVAVSVFDINQPRLPTAFYSVLVSISVFMTLSSVFHSTNSPDNSPLSYSVLPALFFA